MRDRRSGGAGFRAARRRVPEVAGRRTQRTSSPRSTSAARLQRRPASIRSTAVEWELRDAKIGQATRSPSSRRTSSSRRRWSQNATNIVAQKYFRGQLTLARARALGQADDRPRRRHDRRLGPRARLLRHRRGRATPSRPSSPTSCCTRWRRSTRRSGSTSASRSTRSARACFILSRRGQRWSRSSTGTPRRARSSAAARARASTSRTSAARWSRWPRAARRRGPVSFMRGADSWAGTIKSGGKTRRAAKMVVLDVDHPDIQRLHLVQGQGGGQGRGPARRRLRHVDRRRRLLLDPVPEREQLGPRDRRVHAARSSSDGEWQLIARVDGQAGRRDAPRARADARDRRGRVALRRSGRPVRHDDQPAGTRARTRGASTRRTRARSTCTSTTRACNLASLNLMKFRREDGTFDVEAFEHAVDIVFLAQEIIVGAVDLPDRGDRRQRARVPPARPRLRQPRRLPDGRRHALRLRRGPRHRRRDHRADDRPRRTASRRASPPPSARTSATRRTASRTTRSCGCTATRPTRSPTSRAATTELLAAARRSWDEAVELGEEHGYRNAQATVLAPTGTISFLMDCDTTGVEPDFSLVKFKELVGGGQMTIVNRTVPLALQTLGYSDEEIEQIEAHINEHGTIVGAPGPQGRAPAGVRRGGRRARDLAHGPHQDDGRGPAVHLGRDLQDREPARRRRRSRTSPTPTSRRGGSASRRWRSTATAPRRRRRCAPTRRRARQSPPTSTR